MIATFTEQLAKRSGRLTIKEGITKSECPRVVSEDTLRAKHKRGIKKEVLKEGIREQP